MEAHTLFQGHFYTTAGLSGGTTYICTNGVQGPPWTGAPGVHDSQYNDNVAKKLYTKSQELSFKIDIFFSTVEKK